MRPPRSDRSDAPPPGSLNTQGGPHAGIGRCSARKRPGVTTVAVLTLALGLGVNTAIFSVINGVLLKPLPYPSSDRLIHVTIARNTGFGDRTSLPMADFLAWQAADRSCQALAVYTTDRVAVSGAGDADQLIDATDVVAASTSL
jgi:hypothetical protein